MRALYISGVFLFCAWGWTAPKGSADMISVEDCETQTCSESSAKLSLEV